MTGVQTCAVPICVAVNNNLDSVGLLNTIEALQDVMHDSRMHNRGVKRILFGTERRNVNLQGDLVLNLNASRDEIEQFFLAQPTKAEFQQWVASQPPPPAPQPPPRPQKTDWGRP